MANAFRSSVNTFILGDTFNDISQFEDVSNRGKDLVETYVQAADLIVAGRRDEMEEELTRRWGNAAESFIQTCEQLASYRQTLRSVFGFPKPTYGLVMGNLYQEHIDMIVGATANGDELPHYHHDGDAKMAKKQTKQLQKLLKEFYAGNLPYQICFVVSRTVGGYTRATLAFGKPSSFAERAVTDQAERLLQISPIGFETVWAPEEPNVPKIDELVLRRLDGIDYDGMTPRTPEQLQKLHAIALTCMRKTKMVMDGKLCNASRSPLVLMIGAVPNSMEPTIEYKSAAEFVLIKTKGERLRACYQRILESLQAVENPSADVQKSITMAENTLAKCDAYLETPTRVLEIFERYVQEGFWGENRLPILVIYEDLPPNAPIWFAMRILEQDVEGAFRQELERLDTFVRHDNIPEPPPVRSYAQVVSDSG